MICLVVGDVRIEFGFVLDPLKNEERAMNERKRAEFSSILELSNY